jgi:hypothetical protein
MTTLTGTSANTWRDFATRLSAISGENISVSDSSPDHLAKHLQSNAEANLIIFAECPASLIADRFKEPGTLLDEWKTSAATLLALWRKNRQRVTILNWDECLTDPPAFDQWLTSRFGTESSKASLTPSAPQSSLAQQVIANVIVARDRDATRLWNELQAASQPISKKAAVLAQPTPELALAELTRWQDQFAENKQRAIQTHEMLLQEIQNAHKESEDFFEQLEIARVDGEATKQELASVRAAQASDKQELERTATLLQETQRTKQELQSQHDAVQGEVAALKQESQGIKESALRNHEMLLQEIHNAHQESESFFEQWKSLEASVQPHFLTAERILRGGEKHHPPHHHLDYVFESASLFERHWRRLPVRLVEHHGNAGLVIFHSSGNGTTPLYQWEPNGQENGLDLMLFIPSDKKSAAKLAGIPTSDLLLVRDAAAKILGHLSVHGGPEAERWEPIARRLLQEIEEIPDRLHYDSVAGFVHRENDRSSVRFNAAKLYFRGNCASSFVVDWTPASSGGTLRLEANKENSPILLRSASEVLVGFASTEEEETVRKLWPRLTAHDRTFLLLLAKALPDFVFHLCEQHPDQKANQERLTKQARKLYRQLRNLDRRQQVRSAIAKIIGR